MFQVLFYVRERRLHGPEESVGGKETVCDPSSGMSKDSQKDTEGTVSRRIYRNSGIAAMVFVGQGSLRSWGKRTQGHPGLAVTQETLSSHSHTCSFVYSLWLLLCDTCRVQECDRALIACKAENIYCLAL